jgi:hypothetical protein
MFCSRASTFFLDIIVFRSSYNWFLILGIIVKQMFREKNGTEIKRPSLDRIQDSVDRDGGRDIKFSESDRTREAQKPTMPSETIKQKVANANIRRNRNFFPKNRPKIPLQRNPKPRNSPNRFLPV